MGFQQVTTGPDSAELSRFTRSVLRDLRALERMLNDGVLEKATLRLGAEQEIFFVDRGWQPAPIAPQVLEALSQRPEFTTEIAKFNLEINLPPQRLEEGCFKQLDRTLSALIEEARREAEKLRCDVVLIGILPTLTRSHLTMENMSPGDRYQALSQALSAAGGGRYHVHIQAEDELHIEHDSVMLEGSNTSFQVHLQVDADDFSASYNAAQAIAAPVLACAVNSPLLFGKRLWDETRIALFRQSMDTRWTSPHSRDLHTRVRFGESWLQGSVLDIFREDTARFPALLTAPPSEDPFEAMREGRIPTLRSLQVFNSSVWRWNRPCYGVLEGKPHLRIESRFLPSGPTITDEVANAALWIGSVLGLREAYPDLVERLLFEDVRGNFVNAARRGLKAEFVWIDGRPIAAPELLLKEIIPLARAGLMAANVDRRDIEDYLCIIQERVEAGRTGARWLDLSAKKMRGQGNLQERMAAITAAAVARQRKGAPCHRWELASIGEGGGCKTNYERIEQFMTTDLMTVREDEVLDRAVFLMDWRHVRQIPVEDNEQHLIGLVSYGAVLRIFTPDTHPADAPPTVAQVMDRNPMTAPPDMPTLEAIRLMRTHNLTCLPVVADGKLVGIVSVGDFMPLAERLIQELMSEPEIPPASD